MDVEVEGDRCAPTPTCRGLVTLLAPAATLLLIGGVMAQGLHGRLFWDDWVLVEGVDPEASLAAIFGRDLFAPSTREMVGHYYRPMVTLSYVLGAALWGSAPSAEGLVNLGLHLLVCGLLFLLLLRLDVEAGLAAAATAVFGLMPRLTESVFWISGRTDPMAGVFVLLALIVWLGGAPTSSRRWLSAACIGLGLMAKEVAVAGAAAIAFVEMGRLTRREAPLAAASSLARRCAPLLWVLIAFFVARGMVLDGLVKVESPMGVGGRLVLALEALGSYASMLLDPLRPALRIGFVEAAREPWRVGVGSGVLMLVGLLTDRGLRPDADAGTRLGLGLGLASLLPVLHVLPFGSDTVAADRFLYLPWLGVVIAGASVLARAAAPRRRLGALVGGVAAVAFAFAVSAHAEVWADEALLWHRAAARAHPQDPVPHVWLGNTLLERGEPAAALAHYGRVLSLEQGRPRDRRSPVRIASTLSNASLALAALGRSDEALRRIEEAIRIEPQLPSHRLLHVHLLARGLRFEEAGRALASLRDLPGAAAKTAELAALIGEAERRWRALPPTGAQEAAEVLVARALILAELGAIFEASAFFERALGGDDARTDHLLEGARFHALRASVDEAARLLARAEGRPGVEPREVHLLRALLRARRGDAVPDEVVGAARALDAAKRAQASPRPSRAPG